MNESSIHTSDTSAAATDNGLHVTISWQSSVPLAPKIPPLVIPVDANLINVVQQEETGSLFKAVEHFQGPLVSAPTWDLLKQERFIAMAPRPVTFVPSTPRYSRTKDAIRKRKYRSNEKNRKHEQASACRRYWLGRNSVTKELSTERWAIISTTLGFHESVMTSGSQESHGTDRHTITTSVNHVERWFHESIRSISDTSCGGDDGVIYAVRHDSTKKPCFQFWYECTKQNCVIVPMILLLLNSWH